MNHDSKLPPDLKAFEESLRTLKPDRSEGNRHLFIEPQRRFVPSPRSWMGYAACLGIGIVIGIGLATDRSEIPATGKLSGNNVQAPIQENHQTETRSLGASSKEQWSVPQPARVAGGIENQSSSDITSFSLTASSMPSLLTDGGWCLEHDRQWVSSHSQETLAPIPHPFPSHKLDASSSVTSEWLSNDPIQPSSEG